MTSMMLILQMPEAILLSERWYRHAGESCLVLCRKRQQRDVAGLLDGAGQAALVRGANAGEPGGDNLAALGNEALQQTDVAVRHGVHLLGEELPDLFATEELTASAGTAAGTSAAGARSAFGTAAGANV